MSHVGQCETPGRNNYGPIARASLAAVGLPEGYEWCSGHCKLCFIQAHLRLPSYVNGAAASWFGHGHTIYQDGKWLKPGTVPKPGDLLGFRNPGNPDIHHVSLEQSEWSGGSFVYAVEGNWGGCVRVYLRPKATIAAVASYAD